MTIDEIAQSLATVAPPPQRGEILRFKAGFIVINDSYNSNPAALLSMTDTLVNGSRDAKRKIVVAGEMLELGPDEKDIHRQTGAAVAGSGADMLIGVRGLAKELVDGARDAGLQSAEFAADSDAAADILLENIAVGDAVLVKGSRGVKTERIIERLLDKFDLEEKRAANNG